MATFAPSFPLNNGVRLPAVGLGVFQSPPEETTTAVEAALRAGYRLIDTAAAYGNEQAVGEGLRRSGVERSEVVVQTKLWISDYGYDSALRAFDVSLRKLGLERVDVYLLHQPMPDEFERTVAAYRAAERLLSEGRVGAIGVCNFSATHLDDLMTRSTVVPAVNQVELHPFFVQPDLRETHARLGIVSQAWSPIGGIHRYRPGEAGADPLGDPVITGLAERYGKTPAQVILRWHVERGVSAVPKSVHADRIAENIDVFGFALTADEVAAIDALDTGRRAGPDPEGINTTSFTKTIPD